MHKEAVGQKERRLELRIKHFLESYAPEDIRKSNEFHGDLHMLVREIHGDAQSEIRQIIRDVLSNALDARPLYNLNEKVKL